MKKAVAMEDALADLLRRGSWLASGTIGLGFALALIDSALGNRNRTLHGGFENVGIVLFLALPAARVLLMLRAFLRERDFRFAGIAGLVFAMMLLGIAMGSP